LKYASVLNVRLYFWSPSCLKSDSRSVGVVKGAGEVGAQDVTRPSPFVVAEKKTGDEEVVLEVGGLCLVGGVVSVCMLYSMVEGCGFEIVQHFLQ
jgi:hypothetical protein